MAKNLFSDLNLKLSGIVYSWTDGSRVQPAVLLPKFRLVWLVKVLRLVLLLEQDLEEPKTIAEIFVTSLGLKNTSQAT